VSDSPLTVDGTEWDEDAVFELCMARIVMTDEEWGAEGEHEWDISREEAATRVDDQDYSAPDWYHAADD